MNVHGYKKFINTHNGLDVFTESFIDSVIVNHTYCGKIAYGKRKTVLREGTEDEYHTIETDDYNVYEGQYEAIVSEELWEAAQAKKKANGGRKEVIEKDHHYIYSSLLKCPICGKSLYGVPMRGRKGKDGTMYPTYYSYACRSNTHINGIKCGFGQVSCGTINEAMYGILSSITKGTNFSDLMGNLVKKQMDTGVINRSLRLQSRISVRHLACREN
jgi:site-specific DNA recombinase